MSASGGSLKVIVIALAANLGIAASKFVGVFISGSAALLAEAIHSLVDCANQALLIVGNTASRKPPSKTHPLGYGRETFFWSFIVAVLLFSLGGIFAIYEGIHKMSTPEPISSPWLVLSILGLGLALEGYSFATCIKEVNSQNRFGGLWAWFRKTTSADLLVIFTEDAAAMLGLIVATACVSLAMLTGNPAWDAYGSILVGIILVLVAVLLAVEIKSLIIGEAPATDYRTPIELIVKEHIPNGKLLRLLALQTGGAEVMISYKVTPGNVKDVESLIKSLNEIERQVKTRFPEIKWQFIEPDDHD